MYTNRGMWFPVFSANPFQSEGPYCDRRHAGCSSNRMGGSRASPSQSRSSSHPLSSWPSAAAFIPVMLMGGPRSRDGPAQGSRGVDQPNSREEAHRHVPAGGPHSQHLHGFMRDCLPHPEVSDAVSLAQGLLGELFGHSADPSTEAKEKKQEKKKGGSQAAEKRPATQSPYSSPGHSCDKASADCKGRTSPEAQRTSSSPQEMEKDGKADEKAPMQRKGKEEKSGQGAESYATSLWNHSLYFLRFNPNKVTAKLKDGKVHIHASHETTSGPGSCLSKLEARRVVELPPNVDTNTLTCTMRKDGTLVLQASLTHPLPQDTTPPTAEGNTPTPGSITLLPGSTTPLSAARNTEDTAHGLNAMQHDTEMMSQDSCDRQQEGEEELLKEGEHRNGEEEERKDMEEDNEERMEKDDEEPKCEASSGVHKEEDETERITDSLPQKEADGDCHQPMDEDDAQSLTPAVKEEALLRDAAKEACESSHYAEDEEVAEVLKGEDSQQAETGGNADNAEQHPVTLAVIQEPESSDEEEAPHNNTALTRQSPTEDFVVIHEASLSADHTDTAEANVKGCEGSEPVDLAMTEETERITDPTRPFAKDDTINITQHVVDKDDMDITQYFADKEADPTRPSAKDGTDPTRPIKRSEGAADCTQQHYKPLQSTIPDQQLLPESSDSTTTPASPHHNPPAAFRLSLPMVGFSADSVHVSLDGRTLHISASRQDRVGDAPYSEHVQRELGLPTHVDPVTVRCVYLQDQGSLIITADAVTIPPQLRTVPVVAQ